MGKAKARPKHPLAEYWLCGICFNKVVTVERIERCQSCADQATRISRAYHIMIAYFPEFEGSSPAEVFEKLTTRALNAREKARLR